MRRIGFALLTATTIFATGAFAKDAFVPIAGSIGAFRTDARIFNPSSTKDITVQAYYLPQGNADNSASQPVSFTVPKRQMVVYNDVVSTLLHASSPLGAIRFKSDDDFQITERAYATSSASCINSGTLGLSVEGYDVSSAMPNGVLLQLTSKPSYHTNIGAVNPNSTAAHVTWRLYDKNNALVATGNAITMPPFAVIGPTNLISNFFFNTAGFDLTDSWVSFSSDQPIIAYASINDDVTTDPTYIPMLADSGASSSTTPSAHTFDVTLRSFSITISPQITSSTLKQGDQVTFRVTNVQTDTTHGFTLVAPNGSVLIPDRFYPPGSGTVTQTFTVPSQGTFTYLCTNSACGTGHTSMTGSFDVGQPSETDPGSKY